MCYSKPSTIWKSEDLAYFAVTSEGKMILLSEQMHLVKENIDSFADEELDN